MFCPGCGIEEKQANQFCRACGTDLRQARKALEMPDTITASAASAREEIGRAFAAKIREAQTGDDLKIIAEDVLPEIEKFLESPKEKRLRRMRVGTLISSIGLGAAIAFSIIGVLFKDEGFFLVAGMGVVAFFIGLSFVINGILLTVPKRAVSDKSLDAERQRRLDTHIDPQTSELVLPESNKIFTSVTEETTRHLGEKQAVPRK